MNSNKIINSKCICEKGLNWIVTENVIIEPCEHIVHKICWLDKDICPICQNSCDKYYNEYELSQLMKTDKTYYQKYVDIHSMKNINYIYEKNTKNLIYSLPHIFDILGRLPFSHGYNDGLQLCKDTFTVAGVNLLIRGKENNTECSKVIILNHTSYLDFMVSFYVFHASFLSSTAIKDTWIGRKIMDIIPLILIERGSKSNTVEKMKEYIKENGSICLFPEGFMTHPDTIIRFRTGAFNTGYPVLPAVIKYDPVIADSNVFDFLQKLGSSDGINIIVNILPLEYPPFDDNKIEKIRKKMAKIGNMALSRVSNKDIKDKNNGN